MPTKSIFLALLQALAVCASFQDGIVERNPRDIIAARMPQANGDGAVYCSAIGALFSVCDALTPGLFSTSTAAAGCLCYSEGSWVPDVFDEAVSSCADYASTALPATDYELASAFEGFCTAVGDYQASPAPGVSPTTSPVVPKTTPSPPPTPVVPDTTSPVITPIATTPKPVSSASASGVNRFTNPACSYVDFALSFCESVSPGFSDMDASSQAPCLCYSSTAWQPDGFDGPVKTCADFVSTADPNVYSDYVAVEGFCTGVGDVFAVTTDIASSSASGGASVTKSSSGGGGGGGFGLSIPGRPSSSIASQTPTAQATEAATVTTTPRATAATSLAAPVTSTKTADSAPPSYSAMTWALRLVFVAISTVALLQ